MKPEFMRKIIQNDKGGIGMKDMRWRTWEIIGLFWTLAAGNLLHFVYD